MSQIKGGCLCGAVRYQSDAEPVMVVACHCITCQKNTGSAFSLNLGIPENSVTFAGESLATYEDRSGASGKPFHRRFCSRCGSPIYGQGDAYSGLVFIKAGTLDDPSWAKPTAHIWCAEKQPWVTIEEDVAQLPGGPG
ncbi:MAG: GFA family protein [Kiloniellales bacterium]